MDNKVFGIIDARCNQGDPQIGFVSASFSYHYSDVITYENREQNVTFIHSMFEEITFDKEFDYVVANFIFEHVEHVDDIQGVNPFAFWSGPGQFCTYDRFLKGGGFLFCPRRQRGQDADTATERFNQVNPLENITRGRGKATKIVQRSK